MTTADTLQILESLRHRGLSLVPIKPRSKTPLVRWKQYQLTDEDLNRFQGQNANWAIRCDEGFHALDFDHVEAFTSFMRDHHELVKGCPVVHTGRGYHVWFRPLKPKRSFSHDGIEVKGLGSLIITPPSVHPGGKEYRFDAPPNGTLPMIDIEDLFGLEVPDKLTCETLIR